VLFQLHRTPIRRSIYQEARAGNSGDHRAAGARRTAGRSFRLHLAAGTLACRCIEALQGLIPSVDGSMPGGILWELLLGSAGAKFAGAPCCKYFGSLCDNIAEPAYFRKKLLIVVPIGRSCSEVKPDISGIAEPETAITALRDGVRAGG